jgi:hypothetical protein
MLFFRKKKPYYRRLKWIIPFGVIVFLLVVRMILPTAIKIGVNSYLKDFPPSLSARVSDVDLSLLLGVYHVQGISAALKQSDQEFLVVEDVKVSLPWRGVFKNKMIMDVEINKLDLNYSNQLMPAIQKHVADQDKDKKDGPALVKVGRLDVTNSILRTNLFPKLTREEGVVITDLNARVTNLNPTELAPLTPFDVQALLLGSGKIKAEGEAKLLAKPLQWTADTEMKNLDLKTLNKFLKEKVPLTFTNGRLDLYAEAVTDQAKIKGYLKPFIKNLDVIKSREKFEGPKHWLIELVTALGNVAVKANQTVATRVPFVYDKEFKAESDEAIAKVLEHGFTQQLNRGVEHSLGFNRKETKQSQEEK